MCIVEERFRDDVFGIFRECVAVGVEGYYPYFGFVALRLRLVEVGHDEIAGMVADEAETRCHGIFVVVAGGEGVLSL